jgi:hypothetical protein
MNLNRRDGTNRPLLPATAASKGLADLSLGSLASRAAARSLLAERDVSRGEGLLFVLSVVGKDVDPDQVCTCKMPAEGEFALCRCFV